MHRPNVRMHHDDLLTAKVIVSYEEPTPRRPWDSDMIAWLFVGVLLTAAVVLAALPPF